MATGTLRVTPQQLERTASGFESKAREVQTITQQMTSTVTSLTGQVWSGEAATAYVTKFKGLQDDMDRIYKMIQEHSDDLIQMARQYSDVETKNEDLANQLASDVIV